MSGDHLSSKETPQQQLQLAHNRKRKITTRKVRQTHDVTKTSDSCPSKSEDEMLPSRFGVSHSSVFPPSSSILTCLRKT